MKKKILSSVLVLSVFFMLLYTVNALTAKAPSKIPEAGTDLYATVDEMFDFSKIEFKPSSGSENIKGKEDLRKIMLSPHYKLDENTRKIVLSDDWFTAYCLDQTASYPVDGFVYSISNITNAEKNFIHGLNVALKNDVNKDKKLYTLYSSLKNYKIFSGIEFEVPEEYMNGTTKNYEKMINDIIIERKTILVKVKSISYSDYSSNETKTITGEEMNTALGLSGEMYEIELKTQNIVYNMYKTVNMGPSINYNWVLWIIEHSYPTLTIEKMFEEIGVSPDKLEQEIVSLENIAGSDKEEVSKYVENYVYATIQYAIWYVTGNNINGVTLGNELIGSEELNKIYKYYILDRDYSKYGIEGFGSKLTIKKPSTKSEIAEESKTSVKYGPYSVSSNMISSGVIELKSSVKSGVKIVDSTGTEITSLKEDEKFYILFDKSTKVAELTITASTNDGYTFEPSGNRGRVYYAHDPLTQTVGTGGIIKKVSANTSFNILINPKTGITSIATVFILTLIVFSLGYVLLTYKNKPVEL